MDAVAALVVDATDSGPGLIINRIMVSAAAIDGVTLRPDDGGEINWMHDGARSVQPDVPPPSSAQMREQIIAALAASDERRQTRWDEDARLGNPIHPSEQAWLDERAALRAQLAALEEV